MRVLMCDLPCDVLCMQTGDSVRASSHTVLVPCFAESVRAGCSCEWGSKGVWLLLCQHRGIWGFRARRRTSKQLCFKYLCLIINF